MNKETSSLTGLPQFAVVPALTLFTNTSHSLSAVIWRCAVSVASSGISAQRGLTGALPASPAAPVAPPAPAEGVAPASPAADSGVQPLPRLPVPAVRVGRATVGSAAARCAAVESATVASRMLVGNAACASVVGDDVLLDRRAAALNAEPGGGTDEGRKAKNLRDTLCCYARGAPDARVGGGELVLLLRRLTIPWRDWSCSTESEPVFTVRSRFAQHFQVGKLNVTGCTPSDVTGTSKASITSRRREPCSRKAKPRAGARMRTASRSLDATTPLITAPHAGLRSLWRSLRTAILRRTARCV